MIDMARDDGIREIGTLVPCDPEGYIVNTTSIDYLTAPWDAPVAQIVGKSRAYFGERLIALYLRGSLAYGTAIEGVSDLDMFAIVEGNLSEKDLNWGSQLNHEITAAFPCLTDTDVDLVPLVKTENRAVRLVLKTQTVFLWGQDLTLSYPKYKVSYWAAQHVYLLGHQIGEALTDLHTNPSPTEVRGTCSWICKRIIRAGFELVMEREQAFTRDLFPSFQVFAKYYPEQRDRMYAILKLAVFPSKDRHHVTEHLKAIGPWLACEADTRFSRFIETPPSQNKDTPVPSQSAAPESQPFKSLKSEDILVHNPQHRLTLRFGAHDGKPILYFQCGSMELGLSPGTLGFLLALQKNPEFQAVSAAHWQEGLDWQGLKPFLETLIHQGFLKLKRCREVH